MNMRRMVHSRKPGHELLSDAQNMVLCQSVADHGHGETILTGSRLLTPRIRAVCNTFVY